MVFNQWRYMNSSDSLGEGFAAWQRFRPDSEHTLIASLPAAAGVYVIRRRRPFGRFVGETDIAYIGSAASVQGLKGRIRQYFHPGPTQRTNQRIRALIERTDDLELSFVECPSPDDARKLEKRLLSQYDTEHGELPPLNRRE